MDKGRAVQRNPWTRVAVRELSMDPGRFAQRYLWTRVELFRDIHGPVKNCTGVSTYKCRAVHMYQLTRIAVP